MQSSTILIVDDDNDVRRALTELLEEEGYSVAGAANGRVALELMRAGIRPSLILLDLMMPGMSGWEFRAAQLKNARLALIPVVVVTAASTFIDGAPTLPDIELLRKPFDLDTLLTLVGRYAAAAPPGL
jgi:CheY-like chemotaxis protein